jgi:heme A synthase
VLSHNTGANIVTIVLGATVATVLSRYRADSFLMRPALIAAGLLFVQLVLGVTAYIVRASSPNDPQPLNPMISVTVTHVACGALVFAATIVLTLRVFRVLRVERQAYALATA